MSVYSIIMIDEFQDTSKGQWQNFEPLINNILSISDEKALPVTLVGDIKQSIYRWRGGDWRILGENVVADFGRDNIIEQQLKVNYRSSEEVVDFNNKAIRSCVNELNDIINSSVTEHRERGSVSLEVASHYKDLLLRAYDEMEQLTPEIPKDGGYVEVLQYSENKNLDYIIEIIIDAQKRGYKAKDIAVLCRTKSKAAEVVNHILEYKSCNKVDCNLDLLSSEGLMLSRSSVVKFIVALYTLSLGVNDISLAYYNQFLNMPIDKPLSSEDINFISVLNREPIVVSVEQIISRYGLGKRSEYIAYLQAFHSIILNFSQNERCDISSFIEWWGSEKERFSITIPEGQDAITVDTIHKSKGLQYGVVIIPHCSWALEPRSGRESLFWGSSDNSSFSLPGGDEQKVLLAYKSQLEDSHYITSYLQERYMAMIEGFNLLYVALTRAESELYIMIPEKEGRILSVDKLLRSSLSDRLIYGEKSKKSYVEIAEESICYDEFICCDNTNKVVVHTESDKFFKDNESEDATIDGRGRGIVLHSLFEKVERVEDFDKEIELLCKGGFITASEMEQLKDDISEAMINPVVRSWFDGSYKVISERSIIMPSEKEGGISTLRPDRVLIGESGKAIVIDYKFGLPRNSHNKQIQRYKEVLELMGYNNVKGFLWYINEKKFVEI